MTVSRLRLLVDCQGKSTLQFIRHSAIIGEDVAIDFRQETTPHDIVTVLGNTASDQRRAMARDEPASLPAASLWRMHGRKWRLAEAGLFPGIPSKNEIGASNNIVLLNIKISLGYIRQQINGFFHKDYILTLTSWMLFGGFRPAFFLPGENGRLARLPTAVNKRTCNHCDFSLFLMISKSGSLNLHMPITDNIMKIHHLNS